MIPSMFAQGDSLDFEYSAEVEADSAKIVFVSSNFQFILNSTETNGSTYSFVVSSLDSANFTEGDYKYQVKLITGTESQTVDVGTCQVLPDFVKQNCGADNRTHNEKVLDSINAVIEGKATVDQLKMKVGDREINRYNWVDLINLKKQYQTWVKQDKLKAEYGDSYKTSGIMNIEFRRP